MAVLASLGVNFDCSNTNEIRTILEMGVHPDRIIYAHTMKSTSHMKFAEERGITLMTFDCIEELHKVKDKKARLLLRIKTEDEGCKLLFNNKFGCSVDDARHILKSALDLNCNVIGVTFHVGSFHEHPEIFCRAIERARIVFDIAADIGKPMMMLDLGGGFPGALRGDHKFIRPVSASSGQSISTFRNQAECRSLRSQASSSVNLLTSSFCGSLARDAVTW
ncbi:ornithine decarboxylase-like [Dermacentor albipictus]|uniref:ornithine decarboxylase-like n=1 Tax=Dermacentor albipictus TaxID=60249 RepID=UPI0038FC04CE